ncbi:MAG: M55 family metallopeptidase [Tepidisphaeraceae bacterium]|jgi:D-amino peptidase
MTIRRISVIIVLALMVLTSPGCATQSAAPASGPRFYIVTDLEGAAGVDHWAQTREAGPAQDAARQLPTDEVNAAVSGILDAEPHATVDVWDGHGPGGLVKNKLDPRARYLREERPRKAFVTGAYDAVLFVGQHAMVGTPMALLAHTYSSRTIAYYRLNGVFVGEFGALAALAGSRGIPVVFVSGDDKTVLEAQAWVPGIVGAAVKQGRGLESAIHLSHEDACRLLRQRTAEDCRKRASIQPVCLEPPYYQVLFSLSDPGGKMLPSSFLRAITDSMCPRPWPPPIRFASS